MESELTQAEADRLLLMDKSFVEKPALIEMVPGHSQSHDLQGDRGREQFILDLYRGGIRLSKVMMQNRAHKTVILARLELDGAPHTNPDGRTLAGTHVHFYREGFGDKWAQPLDKDLFPDPENPNRVFAGFCRVTHIGDPPSLVLTLV